MITDDHLLLINGIRQTLETNPDFEVIGTYTSAASLLEGLQVRQPDVLILDIQLPDNNSSQLAHNVLQQFPDIRILVLSGFDSSFYVKDMLQQGCLGYLLKTTTDPAILLKAVQEVSDGRLFLDASLKDLLLHNMIRKNKSNSPQKLTQREKQILGLIVEECSTQEIAEKLFLSPRTVENHRFNILQKLGVKNTVGLVKAALQMGLAE